MLIAEPLQKALIDTNTTAAELARRMGTSRSYMSQLLAGKRGVTEETLSTIAHHLGCTVSIDIHFKRIE